MYGQYNPAVGPPKATRSGDRVFSHGRTGVTAPQVTQVITGKADVRAWDRANANPDACMYPPGAREDHDIMRGEVAITRVNHTAKVRQRKQPEFAGPTVRTAVNGIRPDEEYAFAGIIKNEYIAAQNRDDIAVTLQVGGTASLLNTGGGDIVANSTVYWSFPRILTGKNGQQEPAFNQTGYTGNKFVVALHSLRYDSIMAVFQTFALKMVELCNKYGGEELLEEAGHLVRRYTMCTDGFTQRMLQPSDKADVHEEAGRHRFVALSKKDPMRRLAGIIMKLYGEENDWYDAKKPHRDQAFLNRINALQDAPAADPQEAKEALQRDGLGNRQLKSDDVIGLSLYVCECIVDQMRILKARSIGTAKSSAARGEQFDIIIK